MPDSIVKFFDLAVKPPRGSWGFPINGERVQANSESEIIDKMRAHARNNGTYVNDATLEAALWQYLCQREPTRCGMLPSEVEANSPILQPRAITKEFQGPPIWAWLNVVAVEWSEGLHPYFLDTCNAILSILECPDCRAEWRTILKETPPDGLKTRYAVCRWVWTAHNYVNLRRGAAEYPYERFIREWGAPVA